MRTNDRHPIHFFEQISQNNCKLIRSDYNPAFIPNLQTRIVLRPEGNTDECMYDILNMYTDYEGIVTGEPATLIFLNELLDENKTIDFITGVRENFQEVDDKRRKQEDPGSHALVDEALNLCPDNDFIKSVANQFKERGKLTTKQVDALQKTIKQYKENP